MTPLPFRWTGDSFEPLHPRRADKEYVVGEVYDLVPVEQRSRASHAHYFAALTEAWRNLPESMDAQFPTSEHLRKYALIKTGYADERSIVCASRTEALRVAAFIRPMDTYAIVAASEATVKVWTAKSQSMKAMGKAEFEASKTAVLDLVAKMIGVSKDALEGADAA